MPTTLNPDLKIDWRRHGRNGTVTLTAHVGDDVLAVEKIDVVKSEARHRFADSICEGRTGIKREAVMRELTRIAADMAGSSSDGGDDREPRRSQADLLVHLTEGAELFHTLGGHDSEAYATIEVNGHRETWPVNSKGFKRWLAHRFYNEECKAPGSQAIQDSLNVIGGRAIHDSPEHPVAVRLANHHGAIWLDLCDPQWRTVEITTSGWRVVASDAVPIRFVRRRGMLALPLPVEGGSIDELRPLVNLPDDDQWVLFVAWLIAALRPDTPYPVLAVNGEQGSAKSTLCRFARALNRSQQSSLAETTKNRP